MKLRGAVFAPSERAICSRRAHKASTMKRILLVVAMIVLMLGAAKPAAAQNRYIVRTTGGLSSVLNLCNLLGCQVQGGLDGSVGQNFLVTSSNTLLANIVNC